MVSCALNGDSFYGEYAANARLYYLISCVSVACLLLLDWHGDGWVGGLFDFQLMYLVLGVCERCPWGAG